MKYILNYRATTALLALCLVSALSAQDDASFRLGLKAAPNFAWMRSDSKDLTSDGNRTGISYGLLGDFKLNDAATYYFSTGVLLNSIGGKFKADATYEIGGVSTEVKSEQELKLRYIELPLALKLRTKTSGTFNFYGQFGVSTAFNIRARTDATTTSTANGTTTTTSVDDEDVISDIALFKMALVVGAGMEYSLSSGPTLFGGLTYNNAFTNALDGDAKKLLPNDKKSKLFADYLEITLGVFL